MSKARVAISTHLIDQDILSLPSVAVAVFVVAVHAAQVASLVLA
jgi:hypothetical protein